MERINRRAVVYNAMHDFTDCDKAIAQYRTIMANKLINDAEKIEAEKAEAFNDSIRSAIKALSVWIILIIAVATVFYFAAR